MGDRFIGIDVGAETVKIVELRRASGGGKLTIGRVSLAEHQKDPDSTLRRLLADWDLDSAAGAAVSGRLSRSLDLPRIPTKQAQATGYRFLHGNAPATIVSIGSHGFSVLELRRPGVEVFRENSRCSQGTGNFLRQLVERFDLTIEEATELCEDVAEPAALSGRCPVILKTDMTHLANKGESRERILAGLYDAVCENVQVLIKPRLGPSHVLLIGGVSRSKRVREHFRRYLTQNGMALAAYDEEAALFLEAIGNAVLAAERPAAVPPLESLIRPQENAHLEQLPPLSDHLHRVRRLPPPTPPADAEQDRRLLLGLDIGSTGSKVVALDLDTSEVIWEGYRSTLGDPVGAARALVADFNDGPASRFPVLGFGATGSGREIVGSLLSTCYGVDRVHVLNEIAAHAEGALFWDQTVDTIFEIGGQDAKYIRLAGGRIVDATLNEACSAGTGSFIEEQGRKFAGIKDVVHLGEEALAAEGGVSLGQHCSVFMAEIIDEAVAAGVSRRDIIAGIYDSIIQNYLNRVKGSRSVGEVIFCQGMPFSSDALAAAVARQTGSTVIVPPNPGTVGAMGIALLARKNLEPGELDPADLGLFLTARVEKKDTFLCKSNRGCGEAGNHCRIDRIATVVAGKAQKFTWGGGCSLWDKGTGKRKLPDRAPDPFREREALVARIREALSDRRGRPRVALTDEFALKSLFPFFATFIHELGFDLEVRTGADQSILKRGIEEANVPFCAPLQQFHGLVSLMAETRPDFIFLPMLRSVPRVGEEACSVTCPLVQASPDLLRLDLGENAGARVISPVVEFGEGNLRSTEFRESCRRTATALGSRNGAVEQALTTAIEAQERFDAACLDLGDAARRFCRDHDLFSVTVLGRPYTIYNQVLNSNVPALLREQGAMAIPVDCYRASGEVPVFEDVYWGYGQRNLRASHQIRRTRGEYAIWCSNYSCGPDSFNLHFYAYIMEGKPYSLIETDGHSGDAGTKTRIEAFLHCVREDRESETPRSEPRRLDAIQTAEYGFADIGRRRELLLVSRMGDGAEAIAAVLRSQGLEVEVLPQPTRETVRMGRRHTSGKECVPMCVTIGGLLERVEREPDPERRFVLLMPTANGPCRFGVYNLLDKVVIERLGLADRVRIWSPKDSDYAEGMPPGLEALGLVAFASHDMLLAAMYDVRPVETRPGAAQDIYDRATKRLNTHLESTRPDQLRLAPSLLQVANGRLFGCADILRQAALEFAAIRGDRVMPTVMVVGELYVRCEPFTNDFVVRKLEERGLRVRFAPFIEWLEYTDYINRYEGLSRGFGARLSTLVQRRVMTRTYDVMAVLLAWPKRTTIPESIAAAEPWITKDLTGEAVLTVGGPVHEWREGLIDGVVSVGPLECMPAKVAEAQFFHVAESTGLPSLCIPVNGDPVDPEMLDGFAFEVLSRFSAVRRDLEARA